MNRETIRQAIRYMGHTSMASMSASEKASLAYSLRSIQDMQSQSWSLLPKREQVGDLIDYGVEITRLIDGLKYQGLNPKAVTLLKKEWSDFYVKMRKCIVYMQMNPAEKADLVQVLKSKAACLKVGLKPRITD